MELRLTQWLKSIPGFFLSPYRALQKPPESAFALQIAYSALAAAMALFALYGWSQPHDTAGSALFFSAGLLGVAGGVVGALSQFSGLWFLERGAIFALWGALIARTVVLLRVEDGNALELTGRVMLVVAAGFLMGPRFQSIRGADQDPKK